jgi:uncharacterized membrane protein
MDVCKLEPEPCVDSQPVFSLSDDKLINMKEEEPSIPTTCSLVERKVEVSCLFSSYILACPLYINIFIEILYDVFPALVVVLSTLVCYSACSKTILVVPLVSACE